jgi:hypothetical protein
MNSFQKTVLTFLLLANLCLVFWTLTPKNTKQIPPTLHPEKMNIVDATALTSTPQNVMAPCLKLWNVSKSAAEAALSVLGAAARPAIFQGNALTLWWIESSTELTEDEALQRAQFFEHSGAGTFLPTLISSHWHLKKGPFKSESEAKASWARLPVDVKNNKVGFMVTHRDDPLNYQIRFGPWPLSDAEDIALKMKAAGPLKIDRCDAKETQEWELSK